VIAGGEIVACDVPEALGGRDRMDAVIRFTLPRGVTPAMLPAELRSSAHADGGRSVVLRSDAPLRDVHALAGWALRRGLDLPDLDVRRPTLEDVYLSLTDPKEPR
jgi:ABC-2 type transport system ATP-binding protein